MQIAASIFKAYDIRGVVPSTVNEEMAEGLGRAFGTAARQAGESTVAVGRDGRLSGQSLSAALIRGLVATGLGSDAGIENLGQVLDFLSGEQPAVAGRIKEQVA